MIRKAYYEITNVCNANCSFCPGTKREKRFVTEKEFQTVTDKLRGKAEFLYFHLMGEPLLHPRVCDFAKIAAGKGFKVMITTNGLLARERGMALLSGGCVFKISFSLHCYEANPFPISLAEYIEGCMEAGAYAAGRGTIAVFRLWNRKGSENRQNRAIEETLFAKFGNTPVENRSGYRLTDRVFIEYGDRFGWPGTEKASPSPVVFCRGLRDQLGILSDGTVVPCCLDSEGGIPLGNLYTDDLDTVIGSPVARAIYNGFTEHKAVHPLCRSCGFAGRFGGEA